MKLAMHKIQGIDVVILFFIVLEGLLCVENLFFPQEVVNHFLYISNYLLIILIIVKLIISGVSIHFIPLCFFMCFLVFLMGQKPFEEYYNVYLTFTRVELSVCEYAIFSALLYIGIAVTYIAYIFSINNLKKMEVKGNKFRLFCGDKEDIQFIIKALFLITLPCAIYMQFKIVLVRSALAYTSGYLVNVSIPGMVKVGYYIFSIVLLLYFALKPKTSEVIMLIVITMLLQGGIQLLQGRRALFAGTFLFLLWYLLRYYGIDKLGVKNIVKLGIMALVMIILFYIVEQNRGGSSSELSINLFRKFFVSTGGSDSVIANTIRRCNEFPKIGVIYLLNPLMDNPIFNYIFDRSNESQTVAYLMDHDSFSHWISYLTSSELYLSGHGMGSCYLAESYLAFGLGGVLVVSIILGVILSKINYINFSDSVFKNAFIFFMVKGIFTLPRDGLFTWASDFLYLIFTYLLICFMYQVYRKYNVVLRKDNFNR